MFTFLLWVFFLALSLFVLACFSRRFRRCFVSWLVSKHASGFLTHYANWLSQVSAAGYIGLMLVFFTKTPSKDLLLELLIFVGIFVFLALSLLFAEAAQIKKDQEAAAQKNEEIVTSPYPAAGRRYRPSRYTPCWRTSLSRVYRRSTLP